MKKRKNISNFCGACNHNFSNSMGREEIDDFNSPLYSAQSPTTTSSTALPLTTVFLVESKFEDANGSPMPFIVYAKGTALSVFDAGTRYNLNNGLFIQKQFVSATNPNAYASNSATKNWYILNKDEIRDANGNTVSMAIDQTRPIVGSISGNDVVFVASNGQKYFIPTWFVSEFLNGKPYGTNPALAVNVGGLNDRFTVMLQRAYQPTNYEQAEMLRLGTLEKWKQVNDFIGAFLKANISNVAYQITNIGDLESYDFERDITTKYFGVQFALQGVTQSTFKLLVRYKDSTGYSYNNGTLHAYLGGNYTVNADLPYGQEFSLAWFMKNILLDGIFLKLKIGQTGWAGTGHSTVAVDHTVTDTTKKVGETDAQWKARVEAETRAKLLEEIQKSQQAANEEAKASAERTAQNTITSEYIRQQTDYRTTVSTETQAALDKYEAERRQIQVAQNIQKTAAEAQKVTESLAKAELESQVRTDLIRQAMQAGISNVNASAGLYTQSLVKPVASRNQIKVDLTQTAKNQMATNPNDNWTKVNELEKNVWGAGETATAQDAAYAAQKSQARTEDNLSPKNTEEEGSNVWLWVGAIVLLGGLGYGGYYYYENYYKKGK